MIDHHRSNPGFGRKNLIRPDAGGCAEVLYDVIDALGAKFTADIAECIYIGVSTDTGSVSYTHLEGTLIAYDNGCVTLESGGQQTIYEPKDIAAVRLAVEI